MSGRLPVEGLLRLLRAVAGRPLGAVHLLVWWVGFRLRGGSG